MTLDYLKNIVITLGISLLLPFTVYYGFDLVYSSIRPPIEQHDLKDKPQEKRIKISDAYRDSFARWYFYTASICAFIFIIAGLLIKIDCIGIGLIFGGVLTLLSGTLSYWYNFGKLEKFIALMAGLLLLFISAFFVYKKSERKRI